MKFHEISRAEISEADFNPAIRPTVEGPPAGGYEARGGPFPCVKICVCVSSAGSMKEAVTGWVDKSPSWVVDSPNRPVALFRSAPTPPDGVEKHCIA